MIALWVEDAAGAAGSGGRPMPLWPVKALFREAAGPTAAAISDDHSGTSQATTAASAGHRQQSTGRAQTRTGCRRES